MHLAVSIIASVIAFAAAPAMAQDTNGTNLPPVAAPTVTVSVGAIPTVRSLSETAGDFASGLMAALPLTPARRGILVIVDDGHVVTASAFGGAASPARADALSSLFAVIAALQLNAKDASLDATLGQALTRENADDMALVIQRIEKVSGEKFPAYVHDHIFAPLGMNESHFDGTQTLVTPADMSKFLLALSGQAAPILQPAMLGALTRLRATRDPALPGLTYGFSEVRRNGQRALQLDDVVDGAQIVIAPEAKRGYFLVLATRNARIWRAVDEVVFDTLLPPEADAVLRRAPEQSTEQSTAQTPTQTLALAAAVAGPYEPVREPGVKGARFTFTRRRLTVEAGADGSLILSDSDTGVLVPDGAGLWRSRDGNLVAAARDGFLFLNTRVFRPLPLWQRPVFYGVLALIVAVLGFGDALRRKLKPNAVFTDTAVQGFGLTTLALAVLALLVSAFNLAA